MEVQRIFSTYQQLKNYNCKVETEKVFEKHVIEMITISRVQEKLDKSRPSTQFGSFYHLYITTSYFTLFYLKKLLSFKLIFKDVHLDCSVHIVLNYLSLILFSTTLYLCLWSEILSYCLFVLPGRFQCIYSHSIFGNI